MDFDRGLVPCVNRAGILNSDDLIRSRALLNDAADCGKHYPPSEFQLFLITLLCGYVVTLFGSYVVP